MGRLKEKRVRNNSRFRNNRKADDKERQYIKKTTRCGVPKIIKTVIYRTESTKRETKEDIHAGDIMTKVMIQQISAVQYFVDTVVQEIKEICINTRN